MSERVYQSAGLGEGEMILSYSLKLGTQGKAWQGRDVSSFKLDTRLWDVQVDVSRKHVRSGRRSR